MYFLNLNILDWTKFAQTQDFRKTKNLFENVLNSYTVIWHHLPISGDSSAAERQAADR